MFLGELSLLLDSPNLATVRTLKPCRLFRLGKNEFWQMLSTCPTVASQIFRTMATRVKNMEVIPSNARNSLPSVRWPRDSPRVEQPGDGGPPGVGQLAGSCGKPSVIRL